MRPATVLAPLLFATGLAGAAPLTLRVATYNASLNRTSATGLRTDLASPNNVQAKRVAEIIQRVNPDVILINEFDYDAGGVSLQRFHDNYLAVPQNGQTALNFPHRFHPPVNTGVNPLTVLGTAYDFDNNGAAVTAPGNDAYGNDCFGFGWYPGQYGLAVYSKYPIDAAAARTFQTFLWNELPDPAWPDNLATPSTPADWYSEAEKAIFRLSSKTHADVPITVAPGQTFHLLVSHPTPPSFDGAEDRNGRRNREEIRFWAAYIDGAPWIHDDATPSRAGGLPEHERFVILGDLNADPLDGDSYLGAINQLLGHPRIDASFNPSSAGAVQASTSQGGKNTSHRGNPAHDTADFGDSGSSPGNLRVDHVLPSEAGFRIAGGGVFWPVTSDPGYVLITASDHRLVYVDLVLEPVPEKALAGFAAQPVGSALKLTWQTQEGVAYSVEKSADLLAWSASGVEVGIDAQTGAATADIADASAGGPFYRVVATIDAP